MLKLKMQYTKSIFKQDLEKFIDPKVLK